MIKRLIPILVLLCLLGSCAPAPAAPTQTPTATILPTRTPRPTQTLIPTATPYPPLQTDGPYLLFTYDNKNFTIMDADGSGQRQFQLPNDGYVSNLKTAVSPNGEWLVYFTGSTEEPYDFALNLLNLSNDTSVLISNLIAPGFPENLTPVTKTIFFTEYDTDCAKDPKCQLSIVQSYFTESLESGNALRWSHDGSFLAFAAQIDGPSSDIYIFNTTDNSTRRITNELENIWSINWSPNDERILYLDSTPGTIYVSLKIRIAYPNIKGLQAPTQIDGGSFWGSEGWLDDSSLLIWDGGEGAPPHNFRVINTVTKQT